MDQFVFDQFVERQNIAHYLERLKTENDPTTRELRADAKASADAIRALPSDKEYSSSDPAIRATKPTVSEILIGY